MCTPQRPSNSHYERFLIYFEVIKLCIENDLLGRVLRSAHELICDSLGWFCSACIPTFSKRENLIVSFHIRSMKQMNEQNMCLVARRQPLMSSRFSFTSTTIRFLRIINLYGNSSDTQIKSTEVTFSVAGSHNSHTATKPICTSSYNEMTSFGESMNPNGKGNRKVDT